MRAERETKSMIQGCCFFCFFFRFQIFQASRNLETDFSINLKFLIDCQQFRSYATFFVKIVIKQIVLLKQISSMSLQYQGYYLTCICNCKVSLSKSEGFQSYRSLKKVLFHVAKTWYYLENVFKSYKLTRL